VSAMTSALLRLYPRQWRRRYGEEMRALLASEKPSLRSVADLLAGAIDARLNPQLRPDVMCGRDEGVRQMTKQTFCSPVAVTSQDAWRSAAWMIGGSLVLTGIGLALQFQIGRNAFSEGLTYAAFPASLMLSSECTYFKRYSPAARMTLSLGGALLVILMMWASVALGNRI
jgi:hypothetical protein